MIAVVPHPAGAILPVLAQPGARRNAILGERAGCTSRRGDFAAGARQSERGDPGAAGGMPGGEAEPDQPDLRGNFAAEAIPGRRDRGKRASGPVSGCASR